MTTEGDKEKAERQEKRAQAFKRELERDRAAEAKYQAEADEAGVARDEWHRRWSLRLAVANGAGLIGVSTVLLNAFNELVTIGVLPALLISAWLFFVGAALSGSIPFFRSRYFEHRRGWLSTYAQEQGQGGGTVPIYSSEEDSEPSSYYLRKHHKASKFWKRCTTYAEFVAALTFVLGIAGPLAILTARVFFSA